MKIEKKQPMPQEQICQVRRNKRRFLELLLLADEQESMIDRYLDRGELYVLRLGKETRAVCVITYEEEGICELKNLSVHPQFQRKGYGRRMIEYVVSRYANRCHTLLVGTGDSPLTVPFYERCGFKYSHRLSDFFLIHYDHPIFEAGKQLKDMVYLKRTLHAATEAGE